ncbi:hypothetical protein OQA88_5769 [Cercophora sp. LCS_1]
MNSFIILGLTALAASMPTARQTQSTSKGFTLVAHLTDPSKDFSPSINNNVFSTIHVGAAQNVAVLSAGNARIFYENGTSDNTARQNSIITDGATPPVPFGISIQSPTQFDVTYPTEHSIFVNAGFGTSASVLGPAGVLRNGQDETGKGTFLACNNTVPYYRDLRFITLQYRYEGEAVPGDCVEVVLVPYCAELNALPEDAYASHEFAVETAGTETVTIEGDLGDLYPARWIDVPIDHFHNDSIYEPHTNKTFPLRYWFDATHYKEGGPVIVLQGGETSGAGRLPFLQKGILAKLSEATSGLGVVFEHRYYGKSLPVDDFSTKSLRFLSTDQALADMVFFAKNVVFDGLEHLNLTAPNTPYLAFGGSYAGAMVAFLRKLYPDVYWGAISSSGVTEAIYEYWEYFEAARLYAPKDCVVATQKLTHVVDNILIGQPDSEYVQRLKTLFGLGNLTRNDDFANTLSWGISKMQAMNWDPAVNSTKFGEYCNNISSSALLYPTLASLEPEAQEILAAGGYKHEVDKLTNRLLNYVGYVNATAVSRCASRGQSQDKCLGRADPEQFKSYDLSQTWRLWEYQVCTEWGYLATGSGVPESQLPLISRLIDLDYTSAVCRYGFNITNPSNVKVINKHGGFGLSYPRLAFVDGERDPWRAATPHKIGLPVRKSTIDEPYILIEGGVHHWDENGLFHNETTPDLPPKPIIEAQQAEIEFVKAWMEDWKKAKSEQDDAQDDIGDL